ncbi:hypothetical protein AAVH_32629, partial [Aphelenchoides avenae]
MLPTETFADVVSFVGYYDLGGLKLANKLSADVTKQCAGAIRVFDFSGFAFYIIDSFIDMYRLDSGRSICRLELVSEEDLAAFVSDAFRNCTIGRIAFLANCKHASKAIKVVANTTVVARLDVPIYYFEELQELLEFLDCFRRME